MVLCKESGSRKLRLLSKLSALEVSHAIKPYDAVPGGFAGYAAGRPEDSGTRRLLLPILRSGRPRQLRECPGYVRGFCGSARPQGEEGSAKSGSLLPSLQRYQGHSSLRQSRGGQSVCAQEPRSVAKNLGIQDRAAND